MIKIIVNRYDNSGTYEAILELKKHDDDYQISLNFEYTYYKISKKIGIPARHYYDIMMKNNAFPIDDNVLVFEYKEDAEKAFSEIEAYLILNKIIE